MTLVVGRPFVDILLRESSASGGGSRGVSPAKRAFSQTVSHRTLFPDAHQSFLLRGCGAFNLTRPKNSSNGQSNVSWKGVLLAILGDLP